MDVETFTISASSGFFGVLSGLLVKALQSKISQRIHIDQQPVTREEFNKHKDENRQDHNQLFDLSRGVQSQLARIDGNLEMLVRLLGPAISVNIGDKK